MKCTRPYIVSVHGVQYSNHDNFLAYYTTQCSAKNADRQLTAAVKQRALDVVENSTICGFY